MPADITGTDVLEEDRATGRRVFRFVRGPVFANVVLADEINRTPPKTQAALLQSMQEYRVTAGGQTYALPLPFLVFATQNPIEQEGTYPLPEAQLDRFMFQIDVGYPSAEEEVAHRQPADDRLPAGAAQGAVARAHPGAAGPGAARAGGAARRPVRGRPRAAPRGPTDADRARLHPQVRRRGAPVRAPRSSWSWRPRRARSSTAATRPSVEDVRALAAADAGAPRDAQLPRRGRRAARARDARRRG